MNRSYLAGRHTFMSAAVFALLFLAFTASVFAQDADLGVTKNGPANASPGTDITYTIIVANPDVQDSTGPNTLTDPLPAGTTFVSEQHDPGWNCLTPAVGANGTITCTYDNPIAQEASFSFTFVVHIDSNVMVPSSITNTATISHAGADPNSQNNMSSATTAIGNPPPPPVSVHDILISEFRLSGPGGDSDEFIEFYCNRDTNCDISGFSIRTYDPTLGGDFSASFPASSFIPARQYALLISDIPQYSLSGYAVPDFIASDSGRPDFFIDNQGIQLIAGEEPFTVIDSVGFTGGGNQDQYVEGTGLQPATAARPADQYAYVRKRGTETDGRPQDTNNNANDFVLVSVTGTPHAGITAPPVLGAPGPKGLTSPTTYRNSQMTGSLIEPAVDAHVTPNHVRTGSGDSGTLSIRRTFTNNTGQDLDFIRFRVIAITTLNSPNTVGGPQSELRLVTSGDAETFMNSQGRTVVIRGTILEFDPGCGCQPAQPNGGGLNSAVYANLGNSVIAAGETVDVQFLLNVVHAGLYRFYIYVEAFPAAIADAPALATRHTSPVPASARTIAPRKMINVRRSPSRIKPTRKKPKQSSAFPLKSGSVPIVAPSRPWIIVRTPTTSERHHRRKVRVRRKASRALRAKIEAKYDDGEKTSQK